MTSAKPRLFVASSSEALALANAIQVNLMRDAETTVWSQGVFELSQTALESLEVAYSSFDFAVFIFSPDDVVLLRQQESRAVRDNVLFEVGLFAGSLGRDRTFIVIPDEHGDLRIPTDLVGLTTAEYESMRSDGNFQAATGPACTRIRNAISRLGARNLPLIAGIGSEAPLTTALVVIEESVESENVAQIDDESRDRKWLILYLEDKFVEALDELFRLVEAAESDERRRELQAWIARIRYAVQPDEGVVAFERLMSEASAESLPYVLYGNALRNAGRYKNSIEIFDRGITQAGSKACFESKVKALKAWGRDEQAIECLRIAVKRLPDESDLWAQLVDALSDSDLEIEAESVFKEGLERISDGATFQLKYARFLYAKKRHSEALVLLDMLVSRYPQNPEYRTMRGNVLTALNFYDDAMSDYKTANRDAEEGQAWILENIGNLLRNRGFYTEAEEYFRKAVLLDSDSEYGHNRLASTIKSLDDERKKLDDIKKEGRRMLFSAASGQNEE